jgi:hypothetical protein
MYPVFSIRESDSFVNIDARSDASELHAMLTDIDRGHILRECLSCGSGATCGPPPPRAPTVHDAGPSNQTEVMSVERQIHFRLEFSGWFRLVSVPSGECIQVQWPSLLANFQNIFHSVFSFGRVKAAKTSR